MSKLEVIGDRNKVRIEFTVPLYPENFNDFKGQPEIPSMTFNSSLGEIKGNILNDFDGSKSGQKFAQMAYCDKGSVAPIVFEQCIEPLEWSIEREHLVTLGKEDRRAYTLEYWPPFVVENWGNCNNQVVVRFHVLTEDHLDWTDPLNWGAQFDNLDVKAGSTWSSETYLNGVFQIFFRGYRYAPPSWCDGRMELRLDCYPCGPDPYDPPGFETKGFEVDETIREDYKPPKFDEIYLVPGAQINDHVANVLIPGLAGFGQAYGANGSPNNVYDYYMTRLGDYIGGWLSENPDGLVAVVKAYDEASDEGRWLYPFLSIDYTQDSVNYIIEDAANQMFYVDTFPLKTNEYTIEEWPKMTAGNPWWDPNDLYLATDGLAAGEYSVWIIPIDCEWLTYSSARFRIRDDVNNWRRSEELIMDLDEGAIQMTGPDTAEDGQEVILTAVINSDFTSPELYKEVIWSVSDSGEGPWYGPNDIWPIPPEVEVHSDLPDEQYWDGQTFTIEAFHDCPLYVKARIEICTVTLEDVHDIHWMARSGQTIEGYCGSGIKLRIEPGVRRESSSGSQPPNQYLSEVYWIDGPSIPIQEEYLSINCADPYSEGEWHDYALENVPTQPDCPSQPDKKAHFTPILAEMEIGQIQISICIPSYANYDLYEIYAIKPGAEIPVWFDIVNGPWSVGSMDECPCNDGYYTSTNHVWNISAEDCGYYELRVEGRMTGAQRGDCIAEDQIEVFLDKVRIDDFFLVGPIYFGDKYLWGGHRMPHEPGNLNGTVDCSGFITQVLKRLARNQPGDPYSWPIIHMGAWCWDPADCSGPGHDEHQSLGPPNTFRTNTIPLENL
ncbi:MAG TPA: hypothetical protein VGB30_01760 [bacterium]